MGFSLRLKFMIGLLDNYERGHWGYGPSDLGLRCSGDEGCDGLTVFKQRKGGFVDEWLMYLLR